MGQAIFRGCPAGESSPTSALPRRLGLLIILFQNRTPGLYIHVPFCSGKCFYCDFYSVNAPTLISPWLESLAREARCYGPEWPALDTLYLGGGTPSRLSDRQLATLMEILHQAFDLSQLSEATVEVNPEDVTRRRIKTSMSLGFNRISLGVQSFHDNHLKWLGRRHTAERSLSAIEAIRAGGCRNLSLDLIYGLPGQSVADWQKTLDLALTWSPEHLSCYQLTVEPGTRLQYRIDTGQADLLDEELARELFLTTAEYLEKHGYIHYEVSNYARNPTLISQHNSKYWTHTPYLGLGPAAHSFRQGNRWWNLTSVRQYQKALADGHRPIAGKEALSAEQLEMERIYLGLRTAAGLDLNQPPGPVYGQVIPDWLENGWARLEGDRLILTRQGLVISDRLAAQLIALI